MNTPGRLALVLGLFLAGATGARICNSTQRADAADKAPTPAPPRAAAPDTLPPIAAEQQQFFESRVRPVLVNRCYKCHGDRKQEAALRLDSRSAVLAGSENGAVVVAGDPEASKLVRAIRRGGDVEMPPDEKLPAEEREALTAWVKLGLPWPQTAGTAAGTTSPPLSGDALYESARKNHWALQPIRNPRLPEVRDAAWCEMPVDRFVLARLESRGLAPSPRADRRTLIRRATFDLWGLPPTPEDVAAFVADEAPGAFERLVDRLLASPRYGERWGRHWLDAARYSDSRGYAFGRERRFPYAYTYRDYVIRAFNVDLPYDRFLVEQIAADRLELGSDKRPLAALGLLTVGRRYDNQADDIDDRIDVVARGVLGLTVGCARCHDHKYDPISSEDYYSLYGVFASSMEPPDAPVIGRPTELAAFETYNRKLAELQKEIDRFSDQRYAEVVDAARRRAGEYLVHVATTPEEPPSERRRAQSLRPEDLKPRLVERWRKYIARRSQPDDPVFGPWQRLMAIVEPDFVAKSAAMVGQLKDDARFHPRVRRALAAQPPKSKREVAQVYGQLLTDVYQSALKSNTNQTSHGKSPTAVPNTTNAAGATPAAANPATAASPTAPTALPNALSSDVEALRQILFADDSPPTIPKAELRTFLDRAQRNQISELQRRVDQHQVQSAGAPPRPMMLVDKPSPFDPYVFIRGSEFRRGKPVPRQFLKILSAPERKPFTNGSGRMDLAVAIVRGDNPLTARVIVNRVWMHHFGRPLVDSPSDFGLRTPPPSHPELLDYLAWQLREGGWSIKQLHRAIMLSATYQQSSQQRSECVAADPDNRLVWRMNRRRLEFEAQRDALLAAAGRLDAGMCGRPVDLLAQPFTSRRTVYGLVDRQDLPGLFRVFDFASPDQSAAQRPQTTVPQQALFLMNSRFVSEQAQSLAGRQDVALIGDASARVHALYCIVYGRDAAPDEMEIARQFIAAANPATAWTEYAQALLMANEFAFVD